MTTAGGPGASSGPAPIFVPRPEAAAACQLAAFRRFVEDETGQALTGWAALHRFSIEDPAAFWELFLHFSGARFSGRPTPAIVAPAGVDRVEGARFFPDLRLSYVENLLGDGPGAGPERLALVALDERGGALRLDRGALRGRVLAAASALLSLGLEAGDRLAALCRNTAGAAVACLGSAAIGASFSALPADLGADAALERLRPLQPRVLFCHGKERHHGQERPLQPRIAALCAALPSLEAVVLLDGEALGAEVAAPQLDLDALCAQAPPLGLHELPRLPFDHPLFVLFSSGTTGPPKCIVHGAGGTLLQHLKEHRLHCDLSPRDLLYFQTSCGWMMWNWQLSALASGAAILLYDGSVTYPEEDALWRLCGREGVTILGTSPAYLQYCRDAGLCPRDRAPLQALRAILSTGSVLPEALYPYVQGAVGDLPLQSISGGTDLIGCFVLGNPELPVYPGESQCLGLGMDVRVIQSEASEPVRVGTGELVCAAPFPSRPVALLGDEDGRRLHEAYYAQHPGLWTHGDLVELTDRGTARVLGRSDGVLNVRGVRIGPAEIYRALSAVPEIAEAMAVEQPAPAEPGGSRLVLLVVLREGKALDRPLALRIKRELKERCSMAHVPAVIADVPELPTTFSGKRSERAARDALAGAPVQNLSALRNPESLDALRRHPALRVQDLASRS